MGEIQSRVCQRSYNMISLIQLTLYLKLLDAIFRCVIHNRYLYLIQMRKNTIWYSLIMDAVDLINRNIMHMAI